MANFLDDYSYEGNTDTDNDIIDDLVAEMLTSPFHPRHKRAGRAWRRADSFRLKENRKDYLFGRELSPSTDPVLAGKLLHTPKPCSCSMCENPDRKSVV